MKTDKFRYEYPEPQDPFVGVDAAAAHADPEGYTTHEYVGSPPESEAILGRIMDAIDERERDARRPVETVILGRAEYVAVDAWIRHESKDDATIGTYLGDYEIVTVPGRMIHVPEDNRRAIVSHLKGDADE